MTQEKIDSIRERICVNFCWFTHMTGGKINTICEICPLNELEASAEPQIECGDGYSVYTIVQRSKGEEGFNG